MKKCAFLSMDSLQNFDCYDRLLVEPFAQCGWEATEISWRNTEVNWDTFDAVIIRSTWDYQQDPEAFFEVLQEINQSSAHLENSLNTVKWNIDKNYLRDLERQGIEIVPSLWPESYAKSHPDVFFEQLQANEIILKPTISAGADNTFWLNRDNIEQHRPQMEQVFPHRPFIVQPFMPNILSEGEYSLFYFGKTYSHAILKTPEKDDFRVQEEHGGRLKTVEPEPKLQSAAEEILTLLDPLPLYTRIDFVRTPEDRFALMELELIEPSLYFNMDPDSPKRFAKTFDEWMRRKQ